MLNKSGVSKTKVASPLELFTIIFNLAFVGKNFFRLDVQVFCGWFCENSVRREQGQAWLIRVICFLFLFPGPAPLIPPFFVVASQSPVGYTHFIAMDVDGKGYLSLLCLRTNGGNMKLNLLSSLIAVCILIHLFFPVSLWVVDIAPRISDREIIEKLAILEAGQKAIRAEMKLGQEALRVEMKLGQEALRAEMKSGQEALHKRLDDSNNTMLVIFGSLIILIVALFGYIAWDRRTMLKPLSEQVNRLERKVMDDLDLEHSDGSLLRRQLQALREYAGKNPEFAEILRGLSLL